MENKVEYKTISEDRILKEELQRKLNTHFYDEDEKKIKSELLTWCTKKEEKKSLRISTFKVDIEGIGRKSTWTCYELHCNEDGILLTKLRGRD